MQMESSVACQSPHKPVKRKQNGDIPSITFENQEGTQFNLVEVAKAQTIRLMSILIMSKAEMTASRQRTKTMNANVVLTH